MPKDDVDPEDPLELIGVEIPVESEESLREMALCIAEEIRPLGGFQDWPSGLSEWSYRLKKRPLAEPLAGRENHLTAIGGLDNIMPATPRSVSTLKKTGAPMELLEKFLPNSLQLTDRQMIPTTCVPAEGWAKTTDPDAGSRSRVVLASRHLTVANEETGPTQVVG